MGGTNYALVHITAEEARITDTKGPRPKEKGAKNVGRKQREGRVRDSSSTEGAPTRGGVKGKKRARRMENRNW